MEDGESVTASVFFGYPSRPEISRDAIAAAAKRLGTSTDLEIVTWEDLRVSGRLIIDRIVTAIDRAAVSAFDVTTLNENVLFELGYAIASNKRIWLLRDTSDQTAAVTWD